SASPKSAKSQTVPVLLTVNMKQTNTASSGASGGKPKMPAGRASKRGSRVTEERAKAQRTKLDAQAEARHLQADKEAATRKTPNKKTTRQDLQAKRRLIETLIEAYIQDHIGGNHSEKTLEWHRPGVDASVPARAVGYHTD